MAPGGVIRDPPSPVSVKSVESLRISIRDVGVLVPKLDQRSQWLSWADLQGMSLLTAAKREREGKLLLASNIECWPH